MIGRASQRLGEWLSRAVAVRSCLVAALLSRGSCIVACSDVCIPVSKSPADVLLLHRPSASLWRRLAIRHYCLAGAHLTLWMHATICLSSSLQRLRALEGFVGTSGGALTATAPPLVQLLLLLWHSLLL